jgi:predicted GIY-YIG superfamily endonuclease
LPQNQFSTIGYTVRFRSWKLIYKEEFQLKAEAMKPEKQLKPYQGRKFIRELLQKSKCS